MLIKKREKIKYIDSYYSIMVNREINREKEYPICLEKSTGENMKGGNE